MTTARHAQLVRAYVEAHALAALTVQVNRGSARIAVVEALDWRGSHAAIYWHRSAMDLRKIADGIPKSLDLDDTLRLIEVGAERNRIRLTPHHVLIQRADGAINLINARLSSMKAEGELRKLHQEYQDLRLRNAETGKKTPAFTVWMQSKKLEMVRAVAYAWQNKSPKM